jgi:hypothetical protein
LGTFSEPSYLTYYTPYIILDNTGRENMAEQYYSVNGVSERVGCNPWNLTYALNKKGLVPDRRVQMGKITHRIFTEEDLNVIKKHFRDKTD